MIDWLTPYADPALDVASWVCFIIGGFYLIVGSFGMIRLPDFWARLHGAGIVDTLATELFILGMILQSGWSIVTIKLILIGVFLFFTSPTSTHAVANAAWLAGLRPKNMVPESPSTENTEKKS
ncbi:MAG: monovalent cation/H(+) antiporter subunit G [Parvibaculaceae bacterium]|nr:monovalent cation/H(+) antiporter subunit G [Parvibaculaceae bacterium]